MALRGMLRKGLKTFLIIKRLYHRFRSTLVQSRFIQAICEADQEILLKNIILFIDNITLVAAPCDASVFIKKILYTEFEFAAIIF